MQKSPLRDPPRSHFGREDSRPLAGQVAISATVWAASKSGGYKASVRIRATGRWRIKAYHRADAANAATWSGYRSVTVR